MSRSSIGRLLPEEVVMWAGLMLMLLAGTEPAAVKEFNKRVEQYVELNKKVEDALDPIEASASAALLVKQKEQFSKTMQASRPAAKQGDIFTPGIRPILLAIIKQQLGGPSNAKPRSMVLGEGNPKNKEESGVKPVVKVNSVYPSAAPMSTVPPSLLLALPQLPEQLEYRFVGRHLILRDAKTDLIVDFILNAAPLS